jgi:hypothetical protein
MKLHQEEVFTKCMHPTTQHQQVRHLQSQAPYHSQERQDSIEHYHKR